MPPRNRHTILGNTQNLNQTTQEQIINQPNIFGLPNPNSGATNNTSIVVEKKPISYISYLVGFVIIYYVLIKKK